MVFNAEKMLLCCLILTTVTAVDYTVTKRRVDRPIPYTIQYFLTDSQGKQVSCWSDINIQFEVDILTAIIEIPKENTSKMQMVKQYPSHPIAQDIRTSKYNKKIQLRHYPIPLPLVNYGFIPMTWEQSISPDPNGFYGDDDPIDIVDLSSKDRQVLDIVRVKILGAFCLIDEGELDWKVLVIDVEEAKLMNINSHQDLPMGRVQEIISWFKLYKTYEGKPENVIGFGEKVFSKQETLQIIFDTHVEFMKLKQGLGIQYAARKTEFNL